MVSSKYSKVLTIILIIVIIAIIGISIYILKNRENQENKLQSTTEPEIELMKQIIKDFESYERFKEQFTEASKTVEASRLVYISMGSKME